MKKVEKSMDDLMNSVNEITEGQKGMLQGGITVIPVPVFDETECPTQDPPTGNIHCR